MPAKSDDRIRVHKHCKLDAIEDWLEKARSARWRVSKLAVLSGVSVRALNDWFATHRGCTPKQWLEQQQQITAAELLGEGFPVKEVSFKVGFSRPEHFTVAFKRAAGITPTAWLRRHRGGGGVGLQVFVDTSHWAAPWAVYHG